MNAMLSIPNTLNLINALEANLQAHVQLYAGLPGALICDEPGVIGLMTDLDVSESCVYQAAFQPRQVREKISRVMQRYGSTGSLPMWWIVGPSSGPANLGKHLERQSFRYFAHPPGMSARLSELNKPAEIPSDFIIERVTNAAQLIKWVEIVQVADDISESLKAGFCKVYQSQGFGSGASCHLFLGKVDDQPVATSRLFPAGGIAGIYHVATLPEARGHGYGTAMTLAAAHAGRELGYQVGGLFATPAGYPLYHRLGFQEICTMDVYQSPT